jgi:hypothetical protein
MPLTDCTRFTNANTHTNHPTRNLNAKTKQAHNDANGNHHLVSQKLQQKSDGSKQTPTRTGLPNGLTSQQQQPYGAAAVATTTAAIMGDPNGYHQLDQSKSSLLSNGLMNSFQQFATTNKLAGSGKQASCEIHHSVLHNMPNVGGQHHRSAAAIHNAKKNVNFCRAWLNKFPSRSKRIDVISRIFFPKMFALFNLVYWTTYLFREDDVVQS